MKLTNGTEQALAAELLVATDSLSIDSLAPCGISRNSVQARLDDMVARGIVTKTVLYALTPSARAALEKKATGEATGEAA